MVIAILLFPSKWRYEQSKFINYFNFFKWLSYKCHNSDHFLSNSQNYSEAAYRQFKQKGFDTIFRTKEKLLFQEFTYRESTLLSLLF